MSTDSLINGLVVEEEIVIPSVVPQPMSGLQKVGPPPFLMKTYDMVEDPMTDTVVSWGSERNSFVVWDSNEFSTSLLPRYFKHSNFSSFIRQLNTYGFRKVDPDRWEFANEGFLGGQKQLLKTIKRRRNVSQSTQQQGGPNPCVELGQFGIEEELETIKRDRSVLMSEIVKLRQQNINSRNKLTAMEHRLQGAEMKQQQTMKFLAKVLTNPTLVQESLDNYVKKESSRIEIGRKRRLTMSPSVENLFSGLDEESNSEIEGYAASATGASETIWDEYFGDDTIAGTIEDSLEEVDVEVKDLMANCDDWGEDFQDLVDQMGFM